MKECPFTFKLLLFVASFFFPGVLRAQLDTENPLRFLALGDSYTIGEGVPATQRWPRQLTDSLKVRGITTDTLNIIATTGWRTDNLLNAISNKNLGSQRYNFVSLLIGVNNQYQQRSFAQYQREFPALLDSAIRYAGGIKSHVFVVSIPDYAYTPYGQQSGEAATISNELNTYNAFAKHIADSLQIIFIDITPVSRQDLQTPAYVAPDGLHPSGLQYTQWVKLILAQIENTTTDIYYPIPNKLEATIGPNPATDYINVRLPGTAYKQTTQAEVYSTNGDRVLQQTIYGVSASLPVAALPHGVYFLKLSNGSRQAVKRIIKE